MSDLVWILCKVIERGQLCEVNWWDMQGMKIGVMRQVIDMSNANAGVMQLFSDALKNLTNAGRVYAISRLFVIPGEYDFPCHSFAEPGLYVSHCRGNCCLLASLYSTVRALFECMLWTSL